MKATIAGLPTRCLESACMAIIGVAAEQCGAGEYRQLKPGSRVEYRGAVWKVVGIYFDSRPHCPEDGAEAVPGAGKRTKYLILRSLDLTAEDLRPFGSARS